MAMNVMNTGDVFLKGDAIQVPNHIARQISLRAAEIIKTTGPAGPNRSRLKVKPTNKSGQIGVYFPPDARHLIYLDRGIKPRIMTELKGKTIPIRTPNGIIFRKAKNIGSVTLARDEKGDFTNFKLSWSFPGVKALNFIQPALRQAANEWAGQIADTEVVDMLGKMDGAIGRFFGRLERTG